MLTSHGDKRYSVSSLKHTHNGQACYYMTNNTGLHLTLLLLSAQRELSDSAWTSRWTRAKAGRVGWLGENEALWLAESTLLMQKPLWLRGRNDYRDNLVRIWLKLVKCEIKQYACFRIWNRTSVLGESVKCENLKVLACSKQLWWCYCFQCIVFHSHFALYCGRIVSLLPHWKTNWFWVCVTDI